MERSAQREAAARAIWEKGVAGKPMLVTSALPYANGSLHLGHLVESIQSDIFVRFNRLIGRDVLYVCAADTHGTPIEVKARSLGVEPEKMVEDFRQEHARDFREFEIDFDVYSSTHTDENRRWSEEVYRQLGKAGLLTERLVEQFYCENDARFLPDRFVKGTCPSCGAEDQYGDVCEICNSTYTPVELKSPYCVLCRNPPVRRESEQIFVKLEPLAEQLRAFGERLQPEVRNYVVRWLDEGLKDWCISRDGPYFGFRIPDTEDKYFYVWVDAPVGYISSGEIAARAKGKPLHRWWPGTSGGSAEDPSEIVHFIGKDIIYFHTLFWPAMLKASGYALPSRIHVHGMLNFGGAKMSKSRGRMISARDWLNNFDPSYLRYYLAANLGSGPDDIEFSTDELRNRANSQLVNNLGNLVNRVLSFTSRTFEGKLASADVLARAPGLQKARQQVSQTADRLLLSFGELNYREAIREIEALASFANEYMQSAQPWKSVKSDPDVAHADLTLVANVVRALATFISPVVPRLAGEIFAQLGVAKADRDWEGALSFNLVDHTIGTPQPLLRPIEQEGLEALMAPPDAENHDEEVAKDSSASRSASAGSDSESGLDSSSASSSKSSEGSTDHSSKGQAPQSGKSGGPQKSAGEEADGVEGSEPIAPEIVFDDFTKVDLRVGLVQTARKIPKADRLLALEVDLGEGEPRSIVAGVAEHFAPEELVGKRVVVVANLAPRKLRGVVSHGMILAASGGSEGMVLADIPGNIPPGTRVK